MMSMAIARVCLMIGAAASNVKQATGSTSWPSAERSAGQLPAIRLSSSVLPVTSAGATTSIASRPSGGGAQRSREKNTRIAIRPIQ